MTACTSQEARERAEQRKVQRKIAQEDDDRASQQSYDAANNTRALEEQQKLDAVEQKRTNNVYAHSCRKVTQASWQLNAVSVDTGQCTPEQLRMETDAEKSQAVEKMFADEKHKQ